jgi:hypothetical protein
VVRNDVHIEWWRSPRIIMIESPSTTISVQDLVDTCRTFEDDIESLDDGALIDATGKQVLSGAIRVGITTTLLDAQVAFESRTLNISVGTATSLSVTDGLPGVILTDSSATFISDGVTVGNTVLNFNDKSIACVIEVISETQIKHYPLQNGTLNTWSIGDSYQIFPSVACTITGGNVVAVDALGNPIPALSNTTFVNTTLELSTSASIAVSGSGVTDQDKQDIIQPLMFKLEVVDTNVGLVDDKVTILQEDIDILSSIEMGNWEITGSQMIFKDEVGIEIMRFNLFDKNGVASETEVFKRVRV